MLVFRSLLFYIGLSVTTLIFTPIGLLLFPLPFHFRYRVMTLWTRFNLWWLNLSCNLSYEVIGKENIPSTAAIIMSKHQSAFETLANQLIFPAQVWILKRELLWIPIYGWGLASMQPIAIDRGSAIKSFRQIVEQGIKRLEQGLFVIIYPEGTRVAPGDKKTYLPGGGMLANKSGYPIVPVAHNSGHFWPRNSFIKHPGKITISIGPIIASQNKTAKEITSEVEQWIETECQRLSNSLSNG